MKPLSLWRNDSVPLRLPATQDFHLFLAGITMDNKRYAELLETAGDLLQVTGANTFKVRAFQRAARTVSGLAEPVDILLEEGRIGDVDGIGSSICEELRQYRERRTSDLLDELRAQLPAGITDLLRVQGLGPKRVKRIWEELGIGDLATLQEAAENGQIASLSGFGPKTAQNILREIERLRSYAGRTPFAVARQLADEVLAGLKDLDAVERLEVAGSLRRASPTVGDLDFVCASSRPEEVMEAFVNLDAVVEVASRGQTKTTVYLDGGMSADLRVVEPAVFGATLHHFTGSKDHNVLMRQRAVKRGLRISEYGVFERKGDDETPIACATEEDIFKAVGLPWIPPEVRQGHREIERAEAGDLPAFVAFENLKSDLHMHSTWSDGKQSVREMALAAKDFGLRYICITDHSKALGVANGLDEERLLAQIDQIDQLNEELDGIRVLKGIEADILEGGEIDLSADVLERLDWVVGSVHQWMNQDEETMTARLERAVRSGLISAIGHPTGRLIGHREGYRWDFARVIGACEQMGVALEINASPERLDLDGAMVERALESSDIMLTINSDAHSVRGFDVLRWGVATARRGWATSERVLNTLTLEDFLEKRRKPARA